jgi:hypothetical protein
MDDAAGYLRFDPRLLEEATFYVVRGLPDTLAYDRERVGIYAVADAEERERRFRALHASWFVRLELDAPLRQALGEQPSIRAATTACLVARAASPREEGADLHVAPPSVPGRRSATVVVRLRPESFTEPQRLLCLLRRELQHVADMLDPRFGYEPGIEVGEPARRRAVFERYAVLWRVSVEGRLERRGLAEPGARERLRREFARHFPASGAAGEEIFERLLGDDAPTHARLAGLAAEGSPVLCYDAPFHPVPAAS